jgi:hypothetical protein
MITVADDAPRTLPRGEADAQENEDIQDDMEIQDKTPGIPPAIPSAPSGTLVGRPAGPRVPRRRGAPCDIAAGERDGALSCAGGWTGPE